LAQYEVFTFKPSHVEEFVPQKAQEPTWKMFKDMGDIGTEWMDGSNRTVSLQIDGKTAAVMGVMPLPQAGGHVWLFFSDSVGLDELLIATSCVGGFLKALKKLDYEWVQTPVRNDFRQGNKWATMLGFAKTDHEEDIMDNGTMYTYWTKIL